MNRKVDRRGKIWSPVDMTNLRNAPQLYLAADVLAAWRRGISTLSEWELIEYHSWTETEIVNDTGCYLVDEVFIIHEEPF